MSRYDQLIVFVSVLVAALFYYFIPLSFYYASAEFVAYAKILSGESVNIGSLTVTYRSFFYPSVLFLSCVTLLDSPLLLGLFQALLAVVSVWVFYQTFVPYGKKLSLFAGLLFIASFLPFVGMRAVLSEHLFLVTLVGFIFCLVRWAEHRKVLYLLGAVTFLVLSTWNRTTALFIFVPVGLVWLLIDRKLNWSLVAGFLLVLALQFLSGFFNSLALKENSSGAGIFAFMNVYMNPPSWGEKPNWLVRESAPIEQLKATLRSHWAEKKMRDDVVSSLLKQVIKEVRERGANPAQVKRVSSFIQAHYRTDNLDQFVNTVLVSPSLDLYWKIKWAVIRELGHIEADKMLKQAIFAMIGSEPLAYVLAVINNLWFHLRVRPIHYRSFPLSYDELEFDSATRPRNNFSIFFLGDKGIKNLRSLLAPEELENYQSWSVSPATNLKFSAWVNTRMRDVINAVWQLAYVLILGLCIWRPRDSVSTRIVFSCFAIFLYHALVVSMMHPPIGRYVYPVLPFLFAAFVFAIHELFQRWRGGWGASHQPDFR